jgi:hypothetical protein
MSCSIYHASMGAYVAPRARSKVGSIIKKYKSMMLNFELLIEKKFKYTWKAWSACSILLIENYIPQKLTKENY